MQNLSGKQIRILKTFNLYFTFMSLGMCVAIAGPCLIDLQHIVDTDTSHIALIFTARSIGYLIGSIIGGILLDMVKSKQAVLTLCSFFVAGTMLGIPWSGNVKELLGYMIVNGIALGAINNGGNVICLNLWGRDGAPFFQGLHFTYGLGGFISPLIAVPYLGNYSVNIETDNVNTTNTEYFVNSKPILLSNNSMPSSDGISRIVYPFTVIGGVCVINSFTLLAMCIISPTEGSHKSDNKKDNSTRSFGFMLTVIFLNVIVIFFGIGAEIGYAQMLTTFAVKGRLQLTTTDGSYMTSGFWAAFTLSRLACVFLAIKVRSAIMIMADALIILAAAIVLLLLMPSEWALWLASVIFGVGIASFYPSALGWLAEHIHVTSKIASTFTASAAAGEMVLPYVISYFITPIPDGFTYIIAACCILSCMGVFILRLFFKKFDTEEPSKEPGTYIMRTSSITM